MFKLEVEIPAGETCISTDGKRCVMARYTKKWNAYNCAVHNKILKGGNHPRKCRECVSYCNEIRNEEQLEAN